MDIPANCPYCGEFVDFDLMVKLGEGSDHKFACQDCIDSNEED